MSVDLSAKTVGQLGSMLARAETAYANARGARLDSGENAESEREIAAQQRRDAIRSELRARTV